VSSESTNSLKVKEIKNWKSEATSLEKVELGQKPSSTQNWKNIQKSKK